MTLRNLGIIAFSLLIASASTAIAQTNKTTSPFEACFGMNASHEQRLKYCTIVIDMSAATKEQRSFAYSRRSSSYLNSGQIDLAIEDATKAITISPSNVDGYVSRAQAFDTKRDFDSAISDFTKAMSLSKKKDFTTYLGRALAYSSKKNYSSAIKDFDVVIKLDKNSYKAFFYRGFLLHQLRSYDKSLSDYSESIRLKPDYWVSYFRRAMLYFDMKENKKAIDDLNISISFQSDNSDSYFMRGIAYVAENNLDSAIKDFSEAVRLNPNDAASYEGRAESYLSQGDYDRAISDYDAALRIRPGFEKYVQGRDSAIAARARKTGTGNPLVATQEPVTPKSDVSPADVLPTGRRVALVIGNSSYRSVAALPNPSKDVGLVGDAMRRAGIDVTVAHDLDRAGMVQALKAFAEKADAADWAMIYYAGHGIEVAGTNYLIPIDAQLRNDRDVSDETITLQRLLSATEGARKLRLVVLDACRNNPFASQMKMAANSRAVSRGLARIEPENGTLVVYAAKEGTTADDGNGSNSPFAASFAKRIIEPGVEINMTFRLVRQDVMKATGNKQEPFTYGALPPEGLYFVGTR